MSSRSAYFVRVSQQYDSIRSSFLRIHIQLCFKGEFILSVRTVAGTLLLWNTRSTETVRELPFEAECTQEMAVVR